VRAALEKARREAGFSGESIFIIDDSPAGINAAHAAGVASIAVGTGLNDHGSVCDAAPTYFMEDLTDLAAFLRYAGLI